MSVTSVESLNQQIESANQEVFDRFVAADPVLIDIAPAGEVVPGLGDMTIMHSGPPIEWQRMCGAQRGATIGLVLFEGWAQSPDEAIRMLERGAIKLEPNHHHDSVGPMAGTTSPSLPVYVVENQTYGNRAYCRLAEWLNQFGDFSPEALEVLNRWRYLFAPALRQAVQQVGGLRLKPIIAKALEMGDELHNRPVAASSLTAKALAPHLVQAGVEPQKLIPTLHYLANNEFLFLPISMASAKSAAVPAGNVEYSTVVTAMARNGVDFGIRVSGLGDEWFTGPAQKAKGILLEGFTEEDAGLDMGDSTITETVGWGAFTLAGATGILKITGGTPEEVIAWNWDMYKITTGMSPDYRIPMLGFKGSPVGIDIRKVVQTGITPVLDSAIAHREPGYPNLGAGFVRAPMECFEKALDAFVRKYGLPAQEGETANLPS
jgi:uncharacterized protein DUF1116